MKECKNIINFIQSNDLKELHNIHKCNCNYCNCRSSFNIFYSKIKNINYNNNEYDNNINLIWTKSMIFMKKYLLIFENNIN